MFTGESRRHGWPAHDAPLLADTDDAAGYRESAVSEAALRSALLHPRSSETARLAAARRLRREGALPSAELIRVRASSISPSLREGLAALAGTSHPPAPSAAQLRGRTTDKGE